MTPLPPPVADLAARLAELPGVTAVVFGGSRATGTARPDSDWDLGVLYRRGAFDPAGVRGLGAPGFVSALGDWGPIVDGGAWLTAGDHAVDLLFRDHDLVEHRIAEARAGRFDVLTQNGYLAGAPTYITAGELAVAIPLHGAPPAAPGFPEALARTAPPRWEGRAQVSLLYARAHAANDDAVATAAAIGHATLCVAHARLAARRAWALNEKRLVARAGLEAAADVLTDVAAAHRVLGLEPLDMR